MPTKQSEKVKPEHEKDGALSVTIWKNKSEKGFDYNTFSFQRSYKDKEGNWQNTDTFRKSDLLRVARLCQKAYDHVANAGDDDASE
jgi:hypothetical protein